MDANPSDKAMTMGAHQDGASAAARWVVGQAMTRVDRDIHFPPVRRCSRPLHLRRAGIRSTHAGEFIFKRATLAFLIMSPAPFYGCQDLVPRDTQSLFVPRLQHSEVIGILAGLGTTFAVAPDLVAMLRRRSAAGMNPRMASIMGVSQILWVYYGLLIDSRPVIAWNVIAILMNFISVGAYGYFARKDKARG